VKPTYKALFLIKLEDMEILAENKHCGFFFRHVMFLKTAATKKSKKTRLCAVVS